MNFEIKRMTNEMSEQAAKLERECFSCPWSEKAFSDAFDDNNYLYAGAFIDDELVGMAGIIISFEIGEITNVAVYEKYRGKGYARQIMKELMSLGNKIGVRIFTLEVRESNIPAIRLYEELGFKYIGKRPGFYEKPVEDGLIYTLE